MSELEKAFIELREANSKYSIRVLELEQENARLREAIQSVFDNTDTTITSRVLLSRALKGSEE